jgi:hypothetical protein
MAHHDWIIGKCFVEVVPVQQLSIRHGVLIVAISLNELTGLYILSLANFCKEAMMPATSEPGPAGGA